MPEIMTKIPRNCTRFRARNCVQKMFDITTYISMSISKIMIHVIVLLYRSGTIIEPLLRHMRSKTCSKAGDMNSDWIPRDVIPHVCCCFS